MKRRHKSLKRRYREAIRQQEDLASHRVAGGAHNSKRLTELIQSFGHEVHEIEEARMPEAQAVLDEIRHDGNLSSQSGTTTTYTAEHTLPSRSRVSSEVSEESIEHDELHERGDIVEALEHAEGLKDEGDLDDISSVVVELSHPGVEAATSDFEVVEAPGETQSTTVQEVETEEVIDVDNVEVERDQLWPEARQVLTTPRASSEILPRSDMEEASRKSTPTNSRLRSIVESSLGSSEEEYQSQRRRRLYRMNTRDGQLVPRSWRRHRSRSSSSDSAESDR